ncbi:hypothetical protein EF912_18175 [Streptomyces sp. WAC07061]|uniref:hypothetical protein n=1 Tax=Streptomyces sp. WAC07061 TaxID=2487410 RepID=UPI000F7B1E7B|nr:hypothetical protein [Streptomyces sp. WAC07061]RSS53552.1 hypothetical protein EF912_18175 [Streptomyces sp. WAC07061]
MPSKVVSDLIPVLAVPILTAALGGLGLMVKDVRRRRDVEHQCKARLEVAALEVQFITNWMQVRKALGNSAGVIQEAEDWLDRCYRSADAVVRDVGGKPQLSKLRRLLLLKPLVGRPAQTLRVFYWGAFLALNTLTILGLRKVVQWVTPGGESASGGDIFYIAVIIAGFAFFTAGIRKTALTMDDQARNPRQFPDSWPARAVAENERKAWVRRLFVLLTVLAFLAAGLALVSYLYVVSRQH